MFYHCNHSHHRFRQSLKMAYNLVVLTVNTTRKVELSINAYRFDSAYRLSSSP